MARRAKSKSSLQGAELKAFRHKVSQLKKLGGVSNRVDARKQQPTRYMRKKVEKLAPVLSGEAVLVQRKKLRPDILADYERTHQRAGRMVLIPKDKAEKLHVRKGMPEFDRVLASNEKRHVVQRRIPLPIDIQNVDDFIDDLRNNPERWAKKRGGYPPWLFAFKIHGGKSRQLFVEPEMLADDLEKYAEIFEDFWDTFELFAIDQDRFGRWSEPSGKRKQNRKGYKRPPPGKGKLADLAAKKREYRRTRSPDQRAAERAANAASKRNARLRAAAHKLKGPKRGR